MQEEYLDQMPVGWAGLPAHNGHKQTESKKAIENIDFGLGLVLSESGKYVHLPSANQVVLDADLVASNTVNGTIKVTNKDGSTETDLSETTYATSHAATMDAVAAKIADLDGIKSATKGGASNRTLTIVPEDGYVVNASAFVVAAGASQAGVTYNSTDKVKFVSQFKHKVPDSNGDTLYKAGETVDSMRVGAIFVEPTEDYNTASDVYCQFIDDTNKPRGSFTTGADSPIAAIAVAATSYGSSGSAKSLGTLNFNTP